ncbi:MAG: hypothetical protein HW397_227 [Dehalococcoidia bacterium]|jgi:endogenous inhibitor of DNA gyrase (YacG/DUF329 family)|nr:hypothetical protein [Dehalococcoidia bacterium]
MAAVMMKCPEKGKAVPIGMDVARGEWDKTSLAGKVLAKCPACGKRHDVVKRDAFLEDFASAGR